MVIPLASATRSGPIRNMGRLGLNSAKSGPEGGPKEGPERHYSHFRGIIHFRGKSQNTTIISREAGKNGQERQESGFLRVIPPGTSGIRPSPRYSSRRLIKGAFARWLSDRCPFLPYARAKTRARFLLSSRQEPGPLPPRRALPRPAESPEPRLSSQDTDVSCTGHGVDGRGGAGPGVPWVV